MIHTVSGTLVVAGMIDGDWQSLAVDHSATPTDENPDVNGCFALAEIPRFDEVLGFVVLPDAAGTDGNGFTVRVGYIATEGSSGTADLPWVRRGILSDEA
jgi:hypothetical protein